MSSPESSGNRALVRLGSWSLGAKLALFSILFTIAAVATTFLALSLEIRRHSRSALAETLAQHQRMILHLQEESLGQLLRSSRLMTESPTLRAAIDTYRSEAGQGPRARPDLLATIRAETDKIAAGLGRDLLVVTDQDGRVLAASGRFEEWPRVGEDLSSRAIVGRALAGGDAVADRNFGVVRLRGDIFQAGCVPIVLQGFVIGTLTLGDHIDQNFVERLRDAFDEEVVVTVGGHIAGSTFRAGPSPVPDPGILGLADPASMAPESVLKLGGEEYVAAPLRLGSDEAGDPVNLYLLHSLTRTLSASSRALAWTLLVHGALAILLSGVAAWTLSLTLLWPLDRFVRFMRSVAETGDHAHRFDDAGASVEVRLLSETYNRLMDSLAEHERRVRQAAQEEMSRLERLKESEKLAALGRMLSGAAHEINNPLSGVIGNVQLLLADSELDDRPRQRLERVHRESQRIAALVRNLLRIAHRDVGPRAVLDMNSVVRDTVALRRHDFAGAGMKLDFDLATERVRVFGNELELQQVLLNIINNAFDALQETKGEAARRVE